MTISAGFIRNTSGKTERREEQADEQGSRPCDGALPADDAKRPVAAEFTADRGDGGDARRIKKAEDQHRDGGKA